MCRSLRGGAEFENGDENPDEFRYAQVKEGPTTPDGSRDEVSLGGDRTLHAHLTKTWNGFPEASPEDIRSILGSINTNPKAFMAIVGPEGNVSVYGTQDYLMNSGFTGVHPAPMPLRPGPMVPQV